MDEPVHIIGVDAGDYYIHANDLDERHIVPRGDSPDYLPVLRDVIAQTRPDMVWPLHESEMLAVAADPGLGARTFLPPHGALLVCQDKARAYEAFKASGVPVPESYLVGTRGDLAAAFESLGGDVWLRATRGTGGTGALAATDLAAAERWIELNDGWGRFTVAERLTGGTYCWESVWKHGELVAGQRRRRIIHAVLGSPGGSAYARSVFTMIAPDLVEETAIAAVRAVMPEPHGILSVDLTGDRNDIPKVTEINAGRFMSSGVLYWHEHGPNFAGIALRAAFDEDIGIPAPVIDPMPTGLLMVMGINAAPTFFKAPEYEATQEEYQARMRRLGL
jgi:hypothetical protein